MTWNNATMWIKVSKGFKLFRPIHAAILKPSFNPIISDPLDIPELYSSISCHWNFSCSISRLLESDPDWLLALSLSLYLSISLFSYSLHLQSNYFPSPISNQKCLCNFVFFVECSRNIVIFVWHLVYNYNRKNVKNSV